MNIDVTISIHALLAESDYSMGRNEKSFRGYFYPRSPCGERLRGWTLNINGPIFLSTLSLRRATPTQQRKTKTNEFLSTLSLRRATLQDAYTDGKNLFLSTLSLRRATLTKESKNGADLCISIHALLAESDGLRATRACPSLYFYPRSPCGERRYKPAKRYGQWIFLSTLSLRRATTHLARIAAADRDFYPRSPCGERRERYLRGLQTLQISIHALLAESD